MSTEPTNNEMDEAQETEKPPTFLQILASTLAAAFGVQSNKARERDFKYGSIKVYATAGIIFTTIFVISLIFIVKQILKSAGA
ncbi:DUF2970 domain-containing protein [Aurantivibrio plasticivorans]